MDIEGFARDGYLAIRGAVDADVAAACADQIWAALAAEGVSRTDRRTWTRPCVRINCPEGAPFAAAGTSPALTSVYDELLGPGRWTRRAGVGGTVPVRFPSEEDPGDAGHHIEGSFRGGGEGWVNVRSRGRGQHPRHPLVRSQHQPGRGIVRPDVGEQEQREQAPAAGADVDPPLPAAPK